jgi:hypothetical protein
MKKLLIILIAISLFSCKTKTVVTKTDTEVKKDIVEKKDSVKVLKNNSTTISLDDTFAEVDRVEFYYSMPDTNKKQYIVKKITTKVNKTGSKKTVDVSNLVDSLDVSEFSTDKTKTEKSLSEKIKEEIKTPFALNFGLGIGAIAIIFFIYLMLKKFNIL